MSVNTTPCRVTPPLGRDDVNHSASGEPNKDSDMGTGTDRGNPKTWLHQLFSGADTLKPNGTFTINHKLGYNSYPEERSGGAKLRILPSIDILEPLLEDAPCARVMLANVFLRYSITGSW